MSQNLILANSVPLNLGRGAGPATMPVATCTPINGDPRAVTITVDWTAAPYNAGLQNPDVAVAIQMDRQTTPLDTIRSVKIDNTFNDVAVYLQFPDTQDTIICPPNSIVISPVFTRAFNATLYGQNFFDGRAPKTTVIFTNIDRQGLVTLGDIGNHVFANMTEILSGTYNSTMPSAAAVRLGNAYPTRLVGVVTLAARQAAGALAAPNSIVLNGVPLTQALNRSIAPSTARTVNLNISYGIIPGNAGGVQYVYPSAVGFISAAFFVIENYTQAAPFSTNSDAVLAGGGADTSNVSLACVPASAAIYGAMDLTAAAFAPSWIGDAELTAYRADATAATYEAIFGKKSNYIEGLTMAAEIRSVVLGGACWI